MTAREKKVNIIPSCPHKRGLKKDDKVRLRGEKSNSIAQGVAALAVVTLAGSGTTYLVIGDRGSSSTESTKTSTHLADRGAVERHRISGYPLNRTLEALIEDSDSQEIFVVEALESGQAVDLTPTGTGADVSPTAIITPVNGLVTEVLRGDLRPGITSPQIPILGGHVGNKVVEASPEIAPDLSDLLVDGGRILIAGLPATYPELGGASIESSFIYKIDEDGTATSLLESASENPYPTFKMEDLRKRLVAADAPK